MIIFSKFGALDSIDLIRDRKTGESRCYAFINFKTKASAERAFIQMQNATIDGKKVFVDFTQSLKRSPDLPF